MKNSRKLRFRREIKVLYNQFVPLHTRAMPHQTEQALLVMDVQAAIVRRVRDGEAYIARVRTAVDFAHARGVPVIYVVVGFRDGHKDYRITVLSDLCADTDAEVHNVLINKVFPRQADVVSAAEWMKG